MTLKLLSIFSLTLFLFACGSENSQSEYEPVDVTDQINKLNGKIEALMLISGQLETIVNSPFYDCNLADALIRTMCQVAQQSENEIRTELYSAMGTYQATLQSQIDADRTDLANHEAAINAANAAIATNTGNIASNTAAIAAAQASLTLLDSRVTTLESSVVTLGSRVTSAEAAILALQNSIASINGSLSGTLTLVTIGKENVAAGPVYETVLRQTDKKNFSGYASAFGAYQSFGNNPADPTNGSSSVVFTLTAHGYAANDIVELSGLTSGSGLLTGDVLGQFVIQSVTANTFTLTLARNATSGNVFGGSAGTVRKYNGSGMSNFWTAGQASDVAVRQTSAGTKKYNFIIRRISTDVSNQTAELCYDKTNATALFATINAAPAGGSGNIACK
jgi:hypothetical protein